MPTRAQHLSFNHSVNTWWEHVGHLVPLEYKGECLDSCPEGSQHPKWGQTPRQTHWLQENLLLPERYPQSACLQPSDSFVKEVAHALSLEGWLPFRQRDMGWASCEWNTDTQRDRWCPPDQCHALGKGAILKGYSMAQQRELCVALLVWVLVQLPINYMAFGHSHVSERLQEGLVITILPPSQGNRKVQHKRERLLSPPPQDVSIYSPTASTLPQPLRSFPSSYCRRYPLVFCLVSLAISHISSYFQYFKSSLSWVFLLYF